MNKRRLLIMTIIVTSLGLVSFISYEKISSRNADCAEEACCSHEVDASFTENSEKCVFNALMGVTNVDSIIDSKIEEEQLPPDFYLDIPEKAKKSIGSGLDYLMQAQQSNGGWGAGSHSAQHIRDPHAVSTDPATTSIVALAIVRDGSDFSVGKYKDELTQAHNYLLECVESSTEIEHTITDIVGTQIQSKLGQSIDAIMTAQYLTRSLDIITDKALEQRTRDCLQMCVNKIEYTQTADGQYAGGTWAGVLNASYAANALEGANAVNIEVNEEALEVSQNYQRGNYDLDSESGSTADGAGVMLYSVSSSSRSSAADSKRAKKKIEAAIENGVLPEDAEVTKENFEALGYSPNEATQMDMSYKVYESAKVVASQDQVMAGFGNNGGEEFLSFLQTGEGMIIGEDMAWKGWYEKVSQTMVDIQEDNGSWQGHHCITSPVFCTATAVLILSINNDIEQLAAIQ